MERKTTQKNLLLKCLFIFPSLIVLVLTLITVPIYAGKSVVSRDKTLTAAFLMTEKKLSESERSIQPRHEGIIFDTSHADEGSFRVAVNTGSDRGIKLCIQKDNGQNIYYELPNNGTAVSFPFSEGNGTYSLIIYEKVSDAADESKYTLVQQHSCEVVLKDEFVPFLQPSFYVNYSSSSLCSLTASRICDGAVTDREKASRIVDYLIAVMSYQETEERDSSKQYISDPDAVLLRQTGICLDYATLAAAMLRSQGIPTKVAYGTLSSEGCSSFHAWNIVYLEDQGWRLLDLVMLDSNYTSEQIKEEFVYTPSGQYY